MLTMWLKSLNPSGEFCRTVAGLVRSFYLVYLSYFKSRFQQFKQAAPFKFSNLGAFTISREISGISSIFY